MLDHKVQGNSRRIRNNQSPSYARYLMPYYLFAIERIDSSNR